MLSCAKNLNATSLPAFFASEAFNFAYRTLRSIFSEQWRPMDSGYILGFIGFLRNLGGTLKNGDSFSGQESEQTARCFRPSASADSGAFVQGIDIPLRAGASITSVSCEMKKRTDEPSLSDIDEGCFCSWLRSQGCQTLCRRESPARHPGLAPRL